MTDAPGSLEEPLRRSLHHVQQRKKEQQGMSSSKAIVRQQQDLAPELTQWELMREQASTLVASGFLPRSVNTPEKAMAIIQTGKELGLAPMQALRSIHIIEGKPTLSADLIAGLALARVPGSVLRVAETTDKVCVIKAARSGQEETTFRYTWEDAQRAGLVGKQNWKNYPRAMLRARAVTEAARAIFPDAVAGLFDPDELGAVTTATGEVVATEAPVLSLSPHADSREGGELLDLPEYTAVMGRFEAAKADVFDPLCSWDTMNRWRQEIGTKAAPAALSKRLSELYKSDQVGEQQKKALGAIWNSVDRKLTQLEGKLKPPPVEASFTDEPDGTEALAPGREPGADEDEDLL